MLDARPAPDALARPPLPALATDPSESPSRPVRGRRSVRRGPNPAARAGGRPAARRRDAQGRHDAKSFGASDTEGGWVWKDAYEAAEAAVRALPPALRPRRCASTCGRRCRTDRARMLAMLEAVAALEPSHTRRSEEQVRLQQFSTPLPLAYAALQGRSDPAGRRRAGALGRHRHAGGDGGMRAGHGHRSADLHLNEYAHTRARLLTGLFPQAVVTAFNAEAIADRLHDVQPTVVLMNPPFSATPGVDRIHHAMPTCAMSARPPRCCRRAAGWPTITSAHCVTGRRRLAGRLRFRRGRRPHRLHHGDRRPRLCKARHRVRDPPHRAGAQRPRPAVDIDSQGRPAPRTPPSCSMP